MPIYVFVTRHRYPRPKRIHASSLDLIVKRAFFFNQKLDMYYICKSYQKQYRIILVT